MFIIQIRILLKILFKDKQIQLINIMHKNTLIDILFETTQNSSPNKRIPFQQNEDQQIIRKQYENVFRKAQKCQRVSKIIKITQFNSSLVIGDQKVHQKDSKQQQSSFPQRNFNIKKIGDLKAKIALSAQKILETELKKSQKKTQFHLHKSYIQNSSKTPIEKILVTTKCNIKNQAPNIYDLTASISLDEGINITERNNQDYDNKKPRRQPKEIFNSTKKSSKNYKNESSGKMQCIDFPEKSNDFQVIQKKNNSSPRKYYSKHIQQQKKYQQMIEQQKKDMLEIKKELNKNYAKPFNPPENITAFAYIVYEADAKKSNFLRKLSLRRQDSPQALETRKALLNSYKIVVSLNSRSSVQIASLTKIMTCILTLDLAKKYCLKLNEEFVTIGIFEQNIGGTSANIKRGQIYSIQQLLYGLMLPSGNDASLAIAVWGGRLLLRKEGEKKDLLGSTACSNSDMINFRKKDCYERFIWEMNAKANELNMQKTKYANSHGLSNFQNKSCTFDLALLCEYAMNNQQFRQIVSCKAYQTVISIESQQNCSLKQMDQSNDHIDHQKIQRTSYNDDSQEGTIQLEQMLEDIYSNELQPEDRSSINSKAIKWQNTHTLLKQKSHLYIGIKTGVTSTAGPCLASCIQVNGKRYITIVLNCKSMKYRFKDTQALRKWLFNKQQIKYKDQSKAEEKLEIQINQLLQAEEK